MEKSSSGAPVSARAGTRPLAHAAMSGCAPLVGPLVRAGAQPDAANMHFGGQNTALHFAAIKARVASRGRARPGANDESSAASTDVEPARHSPVGGGGLGRRTRARPARHGQRDDGPRTRARASPPRL